MVLGIIFISDESSKSKYLKIIGKEAYKIVSALVVTLLATIGAALVFATNKTDSNEIQTTVNFNSHVPIIVNFTKIGKKSLFRENYQSKEFLLKK